MNILESDLQETADSLLRTTWFDFEIGMPLIHRETRRKIKVGDTHLEGNLQELARTYQPDLMDSYFIEYFTRSLVKDGASLKYHELDGIFYASREPQCSYSISEAKSSYSVQHALALLCLGSLF